MAFGREAAQRVHDQPEHRRLHRVERVAGPGEVHVMARVARLEAVVGGVVDALERERRAEMASLCRVVVDDVEDHLDPGPMERLHHPLELAHLLAPRPGRRVAGVRGEVADRRVAPVVREPALDEDVLVGDVVDGQELHCSHAELAQVRDRRVRRKPGVRPAQVLAHALHPLREPLDVQLVDHRLGPGPRERRVALPVERPVDDDRARDRGCGVLAVGHVLLARGVREHARPAVADRALDRLRVRVDQQLRGIEAMAGGGLPATRDPVAVALPRPDAGHVDVPVVRRPLADLDPLLAVLVVEQAELDAVGVLAEEREVRSAPVPGRAEWERPAGPGRATHRGTVATGPDDSSAPLSRRLPPGAGP